MEDAPWQGWGRHHEFVHIVLVPSTSAVNFEISNSTYRDCRGMNTQLSICQDKLELSNEQLDHRGCKYYVTLVSILPRQI